YAYEPEHEDEVYVELTSSETCVINQVAVSNIVTIRISGALQVEVTLIADTTIVCAGEPVTFTATPVNEGFNPVYRWFINGVEVPEATDAVYSYVPQDGDEVYVELTSSETCVLDKVALSNIIIV